MEIKETHEEEEQKFCFQYIQGHPQTLTMTRSSTYLHSLLQQLPLYLWVTDYYDATIVEKFKKVIKRQLIYCQTIDQAKISINGHQNVIIICSLKFVTEVYDNFNSVDTVKSFLCFDQNASENSLNYMRTDPKLGHRFTKITNNLNQLTDFLVDRFTYNNTRKILPNFISLNHEVYQSNILVGTLFTMIKQETNKAQLFQRMIELARLVGDLCDESVFFRLRKCILQEKVDPKEIFKWYFDQTFLYRLLNNLLRAGRHPSDVYCLQPYFKCLFNSIKQFYQLQNQLRTKNLLCFRGASMNSKELQYFQNNIGCVIQNLGFFSTSKNKEIAKNFAKNALFQIEVCQDDRDEKLDFGFAQIGNFNEEQVLFNVMNQFKILSVNLSSGPKNLNVIKLRYGELARISKKPDHLLDNNQKRLKCLGAYQMRDFRVMISMGEIIITTNQNFEGGLEYWNKYLEITTNQKERAHGLFQLGVGFKNLGNYEQALIYFEKCLQIRKQSMAIDEMSLATTYDRIGQIYTYKGQPGIALSYLKQSFQIKQKILEKEDLLQLACSYNLMSLAYQALCEHQKAVNCYQKCLQIQKEQLPDSHPLIASTYNNLGWTYLKMGQLEKSLKCLLISLHQQEETQGKDYQTLIATYNNIGAVYIQKKQYDKALEQLSKCQQILCKNPCVNFITVAHFYTNFGSAYLGLSQYELALQFLKKALQIQLALLNKNNPSTLLTLNNIAVVYGEMRQYELSLAYYQQIQHIVKLTGANPSQLSDIYTKIGVLYFHQNKFETSLGYFKKSLQILGNGINSNPSKVEQILLYIQEVKSEIKDALDKYLLVFNPQYLGFFILAQHPSRQLEGYSICEQVTPREVSPFIFYHIQCLKINALKSMGRYQEAKLASQRVLELVLEEKDPEQFLGFILPEIEEE